MNVEREASGRAQRVYGATSFQMPEAALAQRAASLGIDPIDLIREGSDAVAKICRDEDAGTALGRIAWRYRPDGSRDRRMGDFGRGVEPWITEEMEAAAESYRTLWIRWYRMVGLPRRHPQGMSFDRSPKGTDSSESPANVDAVVSRMDAADNALMSCKFSRLVIATIDSVLIDNVAPEALILGERSAALAALRNGLNALASVLLRGKRAA